MTSDKRYFEQRAAEEAMRAERAQGEARQWHQELAAKFNRLAEEIDDFENQPHSPPISTSRERRAALR